MADPTLYLFDGHNLLHASGFADPRGQEAFDLAKAKFKSQPQLIGYVTMFEAEFKYVRKGKIFLDTVSLCCCGLKYIALVEKIAEEKYFNKDLEINYQIRL